MSRSYDLAVIGLGALGSSTAWHAARRGLSVIGLEQFELGHARGASHDSSRILRHSYHTPAYVDLTFTAVLPPHYLGASHLDQPGRYQGTVVLRGEEISVDSYGFRDRSWGVRSQFGQGLTGSPAPNGGYSYATASASE